MDKFLYHHYALDRIREWHKEADIYRLTHKPSPFWSKFAGTFRVFTGKFGPTYRQPKRQV
jgi:hypothetical protein